MYDVGDPDDEVVCPYDDTHKIRQKRMQYHLIRCSKNHRGKAVKTCPFNAKHIVLESEYRHHVANCQFKALIETDIIYAQTKDQVNDGTYFKGNTSVPAYNQWTGPDLDEDWDTEALSQPRIGIRSLENPGRIKDTTGMTPAQKRAHMKRLKRRQEREQQGLPFDEDDFEDELTAKKPETVAPLVQPFTQGSTSGLRTPKEPPKVMSMVGTGRGLGRGLGLAQPGRGLQLNEPVVFTGIGRGRGLGLTTKGVAPSPSRPGGSQQHQFITPVLPVRDPNISTDSASTTSMPDDPVTICREIKRLQKKLRQITDLEAAQKAGQILNDDQLMKVSNKVEIESQLRTFHVEY